MKNEIVLNKLLEAYESKNQDLFDEINEEYNLGLISIDQIESLEDRPVFDLSRYYENWPGQYMKNYLTSRFILNMEPLPKHILKERDFTVHSYSYMISHVLNGLLENPNLDDVLNHVKLDIPTDMARKILTSENFIEVESNGNARVTGYGLFRLQGVEWVKFYDSYLDYFDFNDFERYMQEYDTGDVGKNSLNYLEEHLKIAHDKREFNRLHDVFSSKAMVYLGQEKFKKALLEELKIFVLKLNPVYLDKKEYASTRPIEYPNINNINELNDLSEVKSLKRVLYRAWLDVWI